MDRMESRERRVIAVKADVSKLKDVIRCFDEAERAFGAIEVVVVNNAGHRRKPIAEISYALFDRMLASNVRFCSIKRISNYRLL